jgi:hypothetical protein
VAKKTEAPVAVEQIGQMIRSVRGTRVMLDSDLARIYGVETRALVQAVKRNRDRFPADFIIQISAEEWESPRSQTVISKPKGGRRYRPYAFTEHGDFRLQMSFAARAPFR